MSVQGISVEELAHLLHNCSRIAVTDGHTVAHENFGAAAKVFLEWADLSENVRDGYRMQARCLLVNLSITPRSDSPGLDKIRG